MQASGRAGHVERSHIFFQSVRPSFAPQVSGIVVAERPDTQYMGLEGNREFGIQQHNNDDRQVRPPPFSGRAGAYLYVYKIHLIKLYMSFGLRLVHR